MAKENKSLRFAGEQPAKICVAASATSCHAVCCFPTALPLYVAAQISLTSSALTFVVIGGTAFSAAAQIFALLNAAYSRASTVARATTFAVAECLTAYLAKPAYLYGLVCA